MKELRYSEKTQKQQTLSDAKGVGPETDKLKDKFKEGSIPLQTDFNQLIDIADIGRRATGQAPDQNGPAKGMCLDKNGLLQLKLDEKYDNLKYSPLKLYDDVLGIGLSNGLATTTNGNNIGVKAGKGIHVSQDDVSVKAANGIVVDDNGVSVKAGNGITVNADGVQLKLNEKYDDRYNTPLKLHKDVLVVGVNSGLITYHTEDKESHYIGINPGYGLKIDGDSVAIDTETVLPRGMIMMFSGSSVPKGWAFCDGGTYNGIKVPDLRNRFIACGNTISETGQSPNTLSGENNSKAYSIKTNKAGLTVTVNDTKLEVEHLPSHYHEDGMAYNYENGNLYSVTSEDPLEGIKGEIASHYLQGISIPDYLNQVHPNEDFTKFRILNNPNTILSKNYEMIYKFKTSSVGLGKGHKHDVSIKEHSHNIDITPPYYLLAFIMKL